MSEQDIRLQRIFQELVKAIDQRAGAIKRNDLHGERNADTIIVTQLCHAGNLDLVDCPHPQAQSGISHMQNLYFSFANRTVRDAIIERLKETILRSVGTSAMSMKVAMAEAAALVAVTASDLLSAKRDGFYEAMAKQQAWNSSPAPQAF